MSSGPPREDLLAQLGRVAQEEERLVRFLQLQRKATRNARELLGAVRRRRNHLLQRCRERAGVN